MPTKLELQERVVELEDEIDEMYNRLGELLGVKEEDTETEE